MTALTLCSCGLAMHLRRGAYYCEHCDIPCATKANQCSLCSESRKHM